jgi:UTP-glucose-1-phosphate uridylyltransferase/DNA-binding XRE family transcriptional regulator
MVQENRDELGSLLRKFRERSGFTRAQLARRAGISASFVTYLEQGARRPSPAMLSRLMQALSLKDAEKKQLLSFIGYQQAEQLGQHPGIELVLGALRELPIPERDELAEELSRLIGRWKEVRSKRVRRVVIPAAGWQPRLLSPEQLGQMLYPALEEAARAGLRDVILVLAPGKSLPKLRLPRQAKVHTLIQEPQRGLGHAILIAQEMVGDEPFAVVLPDDIMLQSGADCLRRMLDVYERYRCSVLALTQAEGAADFKNYGIAHLGKLLESGIYLAEQLLEKPTGAGRAGLTIVGRYILTPQIFDALHATPPDSNNELQLTDALNWTLRRQRLCAYVYEGQLFRVTPIKVLLEELIDALNHAQPGQLKRAMQITRQALQDLRQLRAGQ